MSVRVLLIIAELEGEATNLDAQVAERLHICIYICLYVYHHTVQVARVKVRYLRQGVEEKHYQRKLQWVKPPRVQVESLCQRLREKYHHPK